MTQTPPLSTYLRHRLLEERELAKSAVPETARHVHATMAMMYGMRLAEVDRALAKAA
ncbi:hypothetical protein [Glacieibacterium sp.]|uniref:hypothetical protein n=1 Tax=Glacieibacterium sp. TaxID=2860237 RepID=UPI003AFFCD71